MRLSVYLRNPNINLQDRDGSLQSAVWRCITVETFPSPVDEVQMICADFDDDRVDEIVATLSFSGRVQ